jgi:WD40 repeat protein
MISVEKIGSFTGHKDSLYSLAGGPEGSFFSSGSDGLVVRWQFDRPDEGMLAARIPNTVYALRYVPGLDLLVAGQNFAGIHLIDCASWKEVGSLRLSEKAIFDLQEADGQVFAALGEGSVAAVDLRSRQVVWRSEAVGASARCLALHPERDELAVGYSDWQVRLFRRSTGEPLYAWQAHGNSVFSLAYSPCGRFLLSGGRDAYLRIWDAAGGYGPHAEIVAHLFTLNHIAYRPDGRYFATCSKDKSIKLWDAEAFRLLKVIDRARHAGHGTSVNKLHWLDPRTLLSASDDRSVAAWRVEGLG